jgi:tetratricopeptide (TPR) repeat protein
MGGIDSAIEACTQLINAATDFAWGYAERGRLRVQKDQRAEALADLEKGLGLNPKLIQFRELRAGLREEKELWSGAIEDYTALLAPGLAKAELYASRGRCYRKLGEIIEAFTDFSKAVELNPNYAWAQTERAEISVLRKEWEVAIQAATEAIRVNPGYVWAWSARAQAQAGKGETALAMADFAQAIELAPNVASLYRERGILQFKSPPTDAALQDLTKALELEPSDQGALALRAEIYKADKKYAEAIQDYDCLLRMDPKATKLYAARAELKLANGDEEGAKADWARAGDDAPRERRTASDKKE